MFCGFQERVGKKAVMLVTIIETKSTVVYDPNVHKIVEGEVWSKETEKTNVKVMKEIKELREFLAKVMSNNFLQCQEVWRLRKQVKYLQERIKEGDQDGKYGMEVNT